MAILAPAGAVKAVVYVWKDAGSGFAYVDDFVFEPAEGSPPAPPSANLVANGGFENGLASWADWGNAGTSAANATRALVYVWKNAGSGFAYVDEVALTPVTSGSSGP